MLRYPDCVLLALTVVVPLHAAEQEVEQPAIVGLARAYVERFVDALSKVVAEERYSQEAEMPAYGVMWIDEGTGRILKTELRLGEKPAVSTGHTSSSLGWAPPTTIATTFGVDEALGIDVPLEMRDRYPFQRNEIKGVATYGSFRRLPGRNSR